MTTDELITKLTAIADSTAWELVVRIESPSDYTACLESVTYIYSDWEAVGDGLTIHDALNNCYQDYLAKFGKASE